MLGPRVDTQLNNIPCPQGTHSPLEKTVMKTNVCNKLYQESSVEDNTHRPAWTWEGNKASGNVGSVLNIESCPMFSDSGAEEGCVWPRKHSNRSPRLRNSIVHSVRCSGIRSGIWKGKKAIS